MSDERVRAVVKREREVRTFAELANGNWVLLEDAKEQRKGCFYEFLSAILMAAFKLEAYLNHVGPRLFPYWTELERLRFEGKLFIICSHLGISRENGRRPYQTISELFKFRNAVAHGRSEFLKSEGQEVGHIEELRRKKPLAKWEQLCTLEFAERAYEDTEEIIKQIHKAAGLDEDDLHRSGHSYEIKRLPAR